MCSSDLCESCDTGIYTCNVESNNLHTCEICNKQVCKECYNVMNNFGMGFQPLNGKCFKCRSKLHNLKYTVNYEKIGTKFKFKFKLN